ncbi:MAG: YjgN family protein, partial [Nitrospira sp.]|nr:YjgN family protein [Nitrospira sp.]
SLGLYYPYFATKKQAFLTQHSYFGSEPFTFSGEGNHLFRPFLNIYILAAASSGLAAFSLYSVVGPLLSESFGLAGAQADALTAVMIPIISVMVGALVFRLLLFPYSVTEQRYFWEQTSIGSAGFHLPITTWPFLKLKLGNFFLMVCTMGLAWPWITIRNIRFITDRLTLVGTENFDAVVQAYDAAPPLGEGLDGFLDTGFDFG